MWAIVDSNHGPLPYQGSAVSWHEDPWRGTRRPRIADVHEPQLWSASGARHGDVHDCRSQGHSGSVSRRGSANMQSGGAASSSREEAGHRPEPVPWPTTRDGAMADSRTGVAGSYSSSPDPLMALWSCPASVDSLGWQPLALERSPCIALASRRLQIRAGTLWH